MTTATPLYGTTAALTITLTGLASSTADPPVGRQSTAISNATDDAIDALVGGKITTGTSPTASRKIDVFAGGSYDDTEYTAGGGASDAGLTPDASGLLRMLQSIPTANTSDKAYRFGPQGLAQAFGGLLPENWFVFVTHNTAVALNATASNHEIYYTPVTYESA